MIALFLFFAAIATLCCNAAFLGRIVLANAKEKLLIKRYASRRLYNTETSDYVTLEDISGFIRDGRDVQIMDLKSGDDLTRQYLLQIIAEHESRGENVLPVDVLTDLVRSYTNQAASVVPQFLSMSFEMLRDGQNKMMENMGMNSMNSMPGFEAMKAQQEAFMKAFGWPSADQPPSEPVKDAGGSDDLDAIKAQLSALQDQLSKMSK